MNCGCVNTCTCNRVTLGVTNGFLTVTVGDSSDTVLLKQPDVNSSTYVRKEFSQNTGNTVNIVDTPIIPLGFKVYRNGKFQNFSSYTLVGNVITFTIAFGNSANAQGNESVIVEYYK